MNKTNLFLFSILSIASIIVVSPAYAITNVIHINTYVDATVTYPDSVVAGKKITISFLITNGMNTQQSDIDVVAEGYPVFVPVSKNKIHIPLLAGQGSFGKALDFEVLPNATLGTQYLNLNLTSGGDIPTFFNQALPIQITEKPKLTINTQAPDAIFENADFTFQVEIEGQGTSLQNVTIQIIPPKEVYFRGETLQTFSFIEANTPVTMNAQLDTNMTGEITIQRYIPFQILVDFTNADGEKHHDSQTVSVLLRPRGSLEWGQAGGFWIGGLYFSPTVDAIGIVVALGVPIGIHLYKKHKKTKITS